MDSDQRILPEAMSFSSSTIPLCSSVGFAIFFYLFHDFFELKTFYKVTSQSKSAVIMQLGKKMLAVFVEEALIDCSGLPSSDFVF